VDFAPRVLDVISIWEFLGILAFYGTDGFLQRCIYELLVLMGLYCTFQGRKWIIANDDYVCLYLRR